MTRVFALLMLLASWIVANVFFVRFAHGLLGLSMSPLALIAVVIAGVWIFCLVYFFSYRVLHFALITTYALTLCWLMVNFGYFKIFQTYLPLTSTRLLSINLPMLKLLSEFTYLVPLSLAASSLALTSLLGIICRVTHHHAHETAPSVMLIPGHEIKIAQTPRRKRGLGFHLLGLVAQVLCFIMLAIVINRAPKVLAQTLNEDSDALGFIDYALARQVRADRPKNLPELPMNQLNSPKTNFEIIRDSLDSLKSSVSFSPLTRPVLQKQPHVIIFQMESVDAWPLAQNPSPMPFLSSLMAEHGTVQNYFANGCTTIDSEFSMNCGFLPETYGPVSDLYAKNSYQCLPEILSRRGYDTRLYHANNSSFWSRDLLAPSWGFKSLNFSPEIPFRKPDIQVLDKIIDSMKISSAPTYNYLIGFTSHAPHGKSLQQVYNSNFHLGIEPYSDELNALSRSALIDEESLRMYFGFLKITDDAIKHLFDRLKTEDLLANTIVIAFGDHRYYGVQSGDKMADFLNYNRIPLLFYVPNQAQLHLPAVASHMDLAPTLYDLITSGKSELPESFVGTSLFSASHRAVAVNKCLGRVSSYNGETATLADIPLNTFEAWNNQGILASPARLESEIKNLTIASDLLLSRNALGVSAHQGAVPSDELRQNSDTDSDHDGLSNIRETAIGTDPYNPDSDGDGYKDGIEVDNGWNPLGEGKIILKK